MYLTDRDIKALLPAMDMHCPNRDHAFDEDDQVQPCSIDLRLSNVFWVARKRWRPWSRRATVDLRRTSIDPLRNWERVDLKEGENITIRPGKIVMGRIYERFAIPPGYAGKIEGRSSFARLGLSVHCTGDFINPGWDRYMPLQLCNHGPYALRIVPYLPVCQLMIVRLSGDSERTYGDSALQSKYANDDGGPSLWWRDERVQRIHERLGKANLAEAIRTEIVDVVREQQPPVIDRLDRYIESMQLGNLEHTSQVLDGFIKREKRLKLADNALLALPAVFLAAVLAAVVLPLGIWLFIFIAATLITGALAYSAYVRRESGYLTLVDRRQLAPSRPGGTP